jgi:hypothetical protein
MAYYELRLGPVGNGGIVLMDPLLTLGCSRSSLMRVEEEVARALDSDDVYEMPAGREVLGHVGRRIGRNDLYVVGDPAGWQTPI